MLGPSFHHQRLSFQSAMASDHNHQSRTCLAPRLLRKLSPILDEIDGSQERVRWTFIIVWSLSMALLWYVDNASCLSLAFTWLGLVPSQVCDGRCTAHVSWPEVLIYQKTSTKPMMLGSPVMGLNPIANIPCHSAVGLFQKMQLSLHGCQVHPFHATPRMMLQCPACKRLIKHRACCALRGVGLMQNAWS